MSRRNTSPRPTIPDDIKARRQQEVEKAKREHEWTEETKKACYRLVHAGNLSEDLGQAFELEQKADKDYLRRWVKAMADYKTILASWPNPNVPPAGITEHNRDAWRVAVRIFLASDTYPDEAVETLAEIAKDDPDFAVSVARWLRREIRRVVEGHRLEPLPLIQPQEGGAIPDTVAPKHPDDSLPAEDIFEQQWDSLPQEGPALTANEYAILQQLARVSPQLIKITDLAAADLDCRRATVSEAVRRLESLGLASRPRGERSGVGITHTGFAVLRPCDRPSPSGR